MNHFAKIADALAGAGLDAVLLTGEANRFYASGFRTPGGDGMALVTRDRAYYFTDSRYTEAAERVVRDAEIREVGRGGVDGLGLSVADGLCARCVERVP